MCVIGSTVCHKGSFNTSPSIFGSCSMIVACIEGRIRALGAWAQRDALNKTNPTQMIIPFIRNQLINANLALIYQINLSQVVQT
jgi:hypothetical protein